MEISCPILLGNTAKQRREPVIAVGYEGLFTRRRRRDNRGDLSSHRDRISAVRRDRRCRWAGEQYSLAALAEGGLARGEGQPSLAEVIRKKFGHYIASGRLAVSNAFVTRDSIQELEQKGLFRDIDLFSLDIDGNDYHVIEGLKNLDARVVVVEYNAKFPPPRKFIMKYNSDMNFSWDMTDYYGASFTAWYELAPREGLSASGM